VALTDYRTLVYQRIWALLNANPQIADVSGNRIDLTQSSKEARQRSPGQKMPSEFPRITVTNGRFTNSVFGAEPSFAHEDERVMENGGWIVKRTCLYKITVESAVLTIGQIDTLEEAVQQAILAGGPMLGASDALPPLPYVTTIGPMTAQDPKTTDRDKYGQGTMRQVTEISLPVGMTFDGPKQLTGVSE
jgi:hypothetical protein